MEGRCTLYPQAYQEGLSAFCSKSCDRCEYSFDKMVNAVRSLPAKTKMILFGITIEEVKTLVRDEGEAAVKASLKESQRNN